MLFFQQKGKTRLENSKLAANFTNWMKYELGLADNTVKAYRQDIENYMEFIAKDLTECGAEELVKYMTHMRKSGSSLETVQRRISGISRFYDFLIMERIVKTNPVGFISKPSKWDKLPVFLNFDEVEKLISTPDDTSTLAFVTGLSLKHYTPQACV